MRLPGLPAGARQAHIRGGGLLRTFEFLILLCLLSLAVAALAFLSHVLFGQGMGYPGTVLGCWVMATLFAMGAGADLLVFREHRWGEPL